jgi:predicted nuclease of restriction endonuclease-like (RecB) superfamily
MKRETPHAAAHRSRRSAGGPPRASSATEAAAAAKRTEDTPGTYSTFLADTKQRIRNARFQASLSVNRELVLLYWSIGRDILTRQSSEGWGTRVIDRLATDLRHAFPELTGFSARNLKYMRSFAEVWPDELIVQQLVAQLPWGHNTHLIDLVKSPAQREWYARQALEHGWSRSVLVHQIESRLFDRQGSALTNFGRKDPYFALRSAHEWRRHGSRQPRPIARASAPLAMSAVRPTPTPPTRPPCRQLSATRVSQSISR